MKESVGVNRERARVRVARGDCQPIFYPVLVRSYSTELEMSGELCVAPLSFSLLAVLPGRHVLRARRK